MSGQGLSRSWRRFVSFIAPSATNFLIVLTLLVFLLQLLPGIGGVVTEALLYAPAYSIGGSGAPLEPWRLFTVVFVHSTQFILHVFFNMLALWLFGQQLEGMLGKWRFVALYFISALGGSVAVLYLTSGALQLGSGAYTGTVGASGAIFGMLGAFFILVRKLGGNAMGLLIVIGLNLAIGFFAGAVSWQAHVGGLVAGGLVGLIFAQTRHRRMRAKQTWLLVALTAVLLVAGIAPGFV